MGLTGSKVLLKNLHASKNPDNPTCIDMVLINKQKSFKLPLFRNYLTSTSLLGENIVDTSQFKLFQTISLGVLNKLAPSK